MLQQAKENAHRGFELVPDEYRVHTKGETVLLPLRATATSAGYDFYTPIDVVIKPQQKVLIMTDVRAYMPDGEYLMLDVTSGIGVKKDCMLANTIGVVDADYYGCKSNGGNIGICLRNLRPQFELDGTDTYYVLDLEGNKQQIIVPKIKDLTEENTVVFKAGDKIAQGIFVSYNSAANCNSEATRIGGFGSTDKIKE